MSICTAKAQPVLTKLSRLVKPMPEKLLNCTRFSSDLFLDGTNQSFCLIVLLAVKGCTSHA